MSVPRVALGLLSPSRRIEDDAVEDCLRYLNGSRSLIRFVQIGSNDGKTNDPLFPYVSKGTHWKGTLVEPIPYLFERLRQNYAGREDLFFEQVAISEAPEPSTFYFVEPKAASILKLGPHFDQFNSFNKAHIIRFLGTKIEPYISETRIRPLTLDSLIRKYDLSDLDLLHVDVEGHDYQVIAQLDLKSLQPRFILCEYMHLSALDALRLSRKLQNHYELYRTHRDLLAVRKDIPIGKWRG